MKRLLLFTFFLLVPTVLAIPDLKVNYPNNATFFDTLVYTDVTSNYEVSFTNTGTNDLLNIHFSNTPNIIYGVIDELKIGETKWMNFSVTTTDPFLQSFVSIISFDYMNPYIVDPDTKVINITSTGFSVLNTTAHRTKTTVKWKNTDSIAHSVTTVSGPDSFDITIPAGGEITRTFSTIGVVRYFDKGSGYSADITVVNETLFSPTHNPTYDKQFVVKVDSKYRPADVTLELYIDSFTISYQDEAQGVLRLVNNLNEAAYNLHLDMADTTFTANDFDLDSQESRIVNFKIKPNIIETADTDKTYNYLLSLNGNNINPSQKTLTVYVRYHDFTINETEGCIDFEAKRLFCQENPTSPICISEPVTINKTVTVYTYPDNVVNITQPEFENLKQTCLGLSTTPDRVENRVKEFTTVAEGQNNKLLQLQSQVSILQNRTDTLISEIYDDRKRDRFWAVMKTVLFLVLTAAAIVGLIFYRRFNLESMYKG